MVQRSGPLNFVVNARPETYDGPLAILVDGTSASTSEILAAGLKDLGRARVFGTKTPGMALPSVVTKLPNGDGFQYAVANYTSTGGEPLEGRGVTPDEEVALDRASLLAGRDPVIDAAVRWIESQKSPGEADMKRRVPLVHRGDDRLLLRRRAGAGANAGCEPSVGQRGVRKVHRRHRRARELRED
jgi:C-terminal processing protease CtpA/Prc